MEDIKPTRKSRFEKGSDQAKEFMATLRSKRGGKPPATPPAAPAATIPPTPTPKRKVNNKLSVDFI
jgi:hypothetical protein